MKHWLYAWLSRLDTDVLATRTSEALREIAVLWVVFANLDKLLMNELTFAWVAVHSISAIVVWVAGLYIEVHGTWRSR